MLTGGRSLVAGRPAHGGDQSIEGRRNLATSHFQVGCITLQRNVIERSVLLSNGHELPVEWLQIASSGSVGVSSLPYRDSAWLHLPLDGSMALEDMDRYIIQTALERHGHNVMATARALGTIPALPYAGIDFMSKDVTIEQNPEN